MLGAAAPVATRVSQESGPLRRESRTRDVTIALISGGGIENPPEIALLLDQQAAVAVGPIWVTPSVGTVVNVRVWGALARQLTWTASVSVLGAPMSSSWTDARHERCPTLTDS